MGVHVLPKADSFTYARVSVSMIYSTIALYIIVYCALQFFNPCISDARALIITIVCDPQSIPNSILLFDYSIRQDASDTEEDEESPLPPERVEGDTECEPPDL